MELEINWNRKQRRFLLQEGEDGFGFCLKVPGMGQGADGEQREKHLFIFNFLIPFSFPF